WQVVALHHMGVPKRNANGDYLDKNNEVIPIIDNKIDVSRVHWIANEGIRISVILKDLKSKFDANNPLMQGILETTATSQDVNQGTPFTQNQSNVIQPMETITTSNKIDLSIPSHLLDTHKKIDISFSVGHGPDTSLVRTGANTTAVLDGLTEESKRLERNMDYSQCKGYQIDFLGHEVPLPLPMNETRHFAAKLEGTDSIVLNYFKFSVIHNAIKRMPFISAINVDGDPEKRKDITKRNDKWIRDNRIDFDVQLNNDFYKKSGFDRGHMSRREDANWGGTAEQAKRNADLTCVHTNACPQVPSLNRSNRGGLWGKLEKEILEKGAEKEDTDTNRITVFSGPIFKESDPTFKGVQIPTEYYKVILWLDEDGSLKATGFTLSQVDLMDNIDFEAVDLDKNIAFAEHMRSLEAIQDATKIDFSHLLEFDTFEGSSQQQIALDTVEMLREHIASHGTSKTTETRKRRSKTKKD
ncbi:MAG: DNA/RNA non-specific endonuclease, partial [Flavobacteriaceae bacterium]